MIVPYTEMKKVMHRFSNVWIVIVSLLFMCVSCKNAGHKQAVELLSETEMQTINDFAKQLTKSINNYEYELIRNSWDDEGFKKRVIRSSRTEQNVFNGIYDAAYARKILYVSVDLVNRLKYNDGRMLLSKIIYYPSHAEIIVTFQFTGGIDFWKYRIELRNKVPKLTDYYSFKDDFWQSQNIRNIIKLSITHTATSEERHQANRSLMESEDCLRRGDSIQALELLYEVPVSHLIGNALPLKRINLAYAISDSVFASALVTEKELYESIYINYLYGYYFNDTIELEKVFVELDHKLGIKNEILDSLKTLNYFWN